MSADADSGKVFVALEARSLSDEICETLRAAGWEPVSVASLDAIVTERVTAHPACLVADLRSLSETEPQLIPSIETQGPVFPREPSSELAEPVLVVASLSRMHRWTESVEEGSLSFVRLGSGKESLVRAVELAIASDARHETPSDDRNDLVRRIGKLNSRDRKVMRLIYEEYPNKAIAAELDISQRTVEGIRAKIFRELGVATGIGLARRLAESHYFASESRFPR